MILTAFLAFGALFFRAQDTLKPVRRNELGLDFTPLIKFYLNVGNNSTSLPYQPVYYLTYRYHFKKSNIRCAIGGDYADSEASSPYSGDTKTYHNTSHALYFRIGYERFENLSKRWQIFYGIDFRPSVIYEKNDAPYWNGGYANGVEDQTVSLGIAPLLGLRFRINNRVSILTESSYQLNKNNSWQKRYFIPVDNSYPAIPGSPKTKSQSVNTTFIFPMALVLTFDI